MLLPEVAKDPYAVFTYQIHLTNQQQIGYLKGKIRSGMSMLDVGGRNPLTEFMEKEFDVKADNTSGDLDISFTAPGNEYDVIIYSHVIEHQFNPLFTLLELKKYMKDSARMYIFLPNKPKFLWYEGHYHEIDRHRMGLLLKRAGLNICSVTRQRLKKPLKDRIGIRPFIRVFCEFNVIYEVSR